jgi:hypothetical protein
MLAHLLRIISLPTFAATTHAFVCSEDSTDARCLASQRSGASPDGRSAIVIQHPGAFDVLEADRIDVSVRFGSMSQDDAIHGLHDVARRRRCRGRAAPVRRLALRRPGHAAAVRSARSSRSLRTQSKGNRTQLPVPRGSNRDMSLPDQVPGVHNITLVLTDRWQGDYGASATILVVRPRCKNGTRHAGSWCNTTHATQHTSGREILPMARAVPACCRAPYATTRGTQHAARRDTWRTTWHVSRK